MDFKTYLSQPLPFEPEVNNYFKTDQKLVIFEIGSCEGEDSIRLKRKYPNSVIYTFEPLPGNIKKIKQNFKKYGLSTERLFQLALSNRNGSAEFYVSSGHPKGLPNTKDWDYGNKSSSLFPPKEHLKTHNWIEFKDKVKVKTQRLDVFCKERSIHKIDFAFIDVQGAELKVLEGAGGLLKKISMIWLEVEAMELYAGQPLKGDVEKFMDRNGFIKIKDTVDNISGDQLYVSKKLHSGPFNRLARFLNRAGATS